ncbi:unnamed protein product [Prorocentrum cordatum]|uniref:Deacetylase sirtuin-type domain-containing protein n=1 Tax=Prorocentrum cordatum TaxID=2364126 RepID=A0ABN9VEF7_9DINO|nr:unnamed protein product [Polarella glacialis]
MTALSIAETPHKLDPERILRRTVSSSQTGHCVDCDSWSHDFSQFRVFLLLRMPKETITKKCNAERIWDGEYEFYFEVIYHCDYLPESLLPYRRSFEKCEMEFAGDKFQCWRFAHGCQLNEYQLQRRRRLIDGEVTAKRKSTTMGKYPEYRPLKATGCSIVSVAELAAAVSRQSCLVYLGAGISADRMMYNADINEAIGRKPDAEVDDQVIGVVSCDRGRNNVASVYSQGLFIPLVHDTTPTLAHQALSELVLAKGWPVVTTNSDLLLEHAGASAVQVGGAKASVEDICSPESLQPFTMLMCVGVGGDHRHVVKRFRTHCPGCPVVALVRGNVGEYLLPGDLVLEGDVQETLPLLTRSLLGEDGANKPSAHSAVPGQD